MPRYLDDRSTLQGTRLKTQLRLGCLPLMCQTARQLGWPDDGAVCPLCDTGAVEDIPHFLQCCPAFSRERQVLITILKDRLTMAGSPGSKALSQFVGGGVQQLLLMLGAKPRFQTPKQHEQEDEEEREVRLQNQARAWWTLDKACKNFVRVLAYVDATILLASTTLLNRLLSSRRSQRKLFGMTTLQSQSTHYDLWGRDGRGPRGCNGHPHRCGRILAGRTGAKQTSSRYGEGKSLECSTSGRTVRLPCVDTWTRGSKATVRCRRPMMA